MKRAIAAAATAALLGGALLLNRGWRGGQESKEPAGETPEQCLERMFDAAQRGDVEAYLACFTAAQRRRIEQRVQDQSPEAFAQSLAAAVRSLKGRAITGDPSPPANADRMELTVERIYANRNERQTYVLVRRDGRWLIDEVQAAQPFQPPIPYGTPVFEPPEQDQD